MGPHYAGALGYADYVTLICSSANGLQEMIQICEIFGKEYGVKYNPKKTMCMHVYV